MQIQRNNSFLEKASEILLQFFRLYYFNGVLLELPEI